MAIEYDEIGVWSEVKVRGGNVKEVQAPSEVSGCISPRQLTRVSKHLTQIQGNGHETLALGVVLKLPSVRTLHVNLDDAMKEDSDQQADLVRISGKSS
jgi:hypothetical protein